MLTQISSLELAINCYPWTVPDFLAFYNKLLNLAGFRKVLKKYEKLTNTTVLGAYMKEKVCRHGS